MNLTFADKRYYLYGLMEAINFDPNACDIYRKPNLNNLGYSLTSFASFTSICDNFFNNKLFYELSDKGLFIQYGDSEVLDICKKFFDKNYRMKRNELIKLYKYSDYIELKPICSNEELREFKMPWKKLFNIEKIKGIKWELLKLKEEYAKEYLDYLDGIYSFDIQKAMTKATI